MVPKRRATQPPSVINRCNAFNLGLSLGILFLVVRFWSLARPAEPPPQQPDAFEEKLDPAVIDVATWPKTPSDADCAFAASYGPGGANETQALLLRGGAHSWRPTNNVSLNKLAHRYPKLVGTVTISPSPVFTLFANSSAQQYADAHLTAAQVPAKLQNWPLSQFQARMRPPSPRRPRPANLFYEREFYYWSGQPPASLGDQPDRPPLSCFVQPSEQPGQEQLHVTTARLRLTAKASVHVLHYDVSPSLLVQLSGKKLVTLVPPDQMPYMYPYPRGHLMFRRAKLDLLHPDYEKYPLAKKLHPTEVVMSAGDVLIFPAATGHQTRALADNVNMSFRFKNQFRW